MISAVLAFAVVAAFLVRSGQFPTRPENAGLMAAVLVVVALGALVAYRLLRYRMVWNLRRAWHERVSSADAGRELAGPFFTLRLIPAALAEAVGLLGVVFHLLSGSPWMLAAPALAAGTLVTLFPSPDAAARFVRQITGRQWS